MFVHKNVRDFFSYYRVWAKIVYVKVLKSRLTQRKNFLFFFFGFDYEFFILTFKNTHFSGY
jgi:hypothetical protein